MDTVDATVESLLRNVADALPGGSVNVFDREHRYLFVAGPGLAEVGLTPEALIGRTLREVFGAAAAQVEPFYDRAFAGERVSFDLLVAGRVYALTVAPMSAPAAAIVVLAQDVTEVREEIRLHEAAAAALDAVNRQKDVFLATVLHELRQPLAPLRFGLELLKRADGDARARTVATMERQVQHLERLLMDLTELAHTGLAGLELRIGRVDVMQILRDVLEETDAVARARQHQLDSRLLASVFVAGDPVRLRQIFSNLLVNATKYTEPGGRITIAATVTGREVAVSVADNGRGIDPATLPHVFELFVQEDAHALGMGVGLHVVQQIVTRHGGRVEARSAGKGSEFVVYLPITD